MTDSVVRRVGPIAREAVVDRDWLRECRPVTPIGGRVRAEGARVHHARVRLDVTALALGVRPFCVNERYSQHLRDICVAGLSLRGPVKWEKNRMI